MSNTLLPPGFAVAFRFPIHVRGNVEVHNTTCGPCGCILTSAAFSRCLTTPICARLPLCCTVLQLLIPRSIQSPVCLCTPWSICSLLFYSMHYFCSASSPPAFNRRVAWHCLHTQTMVTSGFYESNCCFGSHRNASASCCGPTHSL